MTNATNYLLGQGKVYIASRDSAGKPGAQRWLCDVSDAKAGLKTDMVDQKESYSGQRGTVKKVVIGKEATVDLTLMELSKENLALALFGKSAMIAAGSITAEPLPPALIAGDRVSLKYPKVSTVVITDSAVTPVTVNTADYAVDADFGTITLSNVGTYTQPFKVAYMHGDIENVSMFTSAQPEVFLRYEGINLAENNQPIIVEFYKVNTDPLKELMLISTKMAEMQISATVLIDTTKPVSDEMGQFGRILRPA